MFQQGDQVHHVKTGILMCVLRDGLPALGNFAAPARRWTLCKWYPLNPEDGDRESVRGWIPRDELVLRNEAHTLCEQVDD